MRKYKLNEKRTIYYFMIVTKYIAIYIVEISEKCISSYFNLEFFMLLLPGNGKPY